jgi:hypothetical protein
MTEILPSIAQPARLSEALRRCGAHRDGAVRDVTVDSSRATLLSRIIRLRIERIVAAIDDLGCRDLLT